MKEGLTNKPQIILQNLLKEKRKIKGISQKEMSERLGFPQSSISKYESGERRLDFIELMLVCKALDTNLSDFVLEFEEKIKESK